MSITEIVFYLIGYGLFLLFTAMAINGLHITTRGETETLPDGSTGKVNDMIFYSLLQLVKKEKGTRRIYYQGEELKKLLRITAKRVSVPPPDSIADAYLRYDNGRAFQAITLWKENASDYLGEQDIVIDSTERFLGDPAYDNWGVPVGEIPKPYAEICFYKEYPIYYLPKYVRKPILECLKCMASVWGTLIYWPVMLFFFPFDWLMFPLWILFCFSLSWMNTFLYRKAN
jgi:hypothetical protein